LQAAEPLRFTPWAAFRGTNGITVSTNPASEYVLIDGAALTNTHLYLLLTGDTATGPINIYGTAQIMEEISSDQANTFLLINNSNATGNATLLLRNALAGFGWRVVSDGSSNRMLFSQEGLNTKGGFIADPFSGLFFVGDTTSDVIFKEVSDGNLSIFRHDQQQYASLTASNGNFSGRVSITNGGLIIKGFNATSDYVWTCTNSLTGEGEWRYTPGLIALSNNLTSADQNAVDTTSNGVVNLHGPQIAALSNKVDNLNGIATNLSIVNGNMMAASSFTSTNKDGKGTWRPFLNAGESYTTYWVPTSKIPPVGSGVLTNSTIGANLGTAGTLRNVLATTAGGPWFQQETSTTANNTSFMNCLDNNYAPSGGGHNTYWKCTMQPLSTNNCRIFVGMQSIAGLLFYTNSLSSGCFQCVLRYDSTTGDNDWVAIIGNGIGLPTTNKTGVVVSERTTYICEGIADDSVPSFTFRINGVSTTLTGTNVPSSSTTLMSASCSINTTNTVAKTNRFRGWYDSFYY
jgi:hypothetical protein